MIPRAHHDPAIVAEWQRWVILSRRTSRTAVVLWAGLGVMLMAPTLAGVVPFWPYVPAVMLAMALLYANRRGSMKLDVRCPACGEYPVAGRQIVAISQVEHCERCSAWLKNPRRGRYA